MLSTSSVWGQASLPFTYDSGKPSSVTGLTQSGLGTDYSSSPKMKFDTSGDNLILNFSSAPGTLSFKIQWNQSSSATRFPGDFTLLESDNGTTYTTVQLYNSTSGTALPNSTTKTESFSNLKSTTRYLKWEYTTKSNGNIGLGAISLSAGAVAPVVTASQSYTPTVGVAFSQQIAASNSPTSYAVSNGSLPTGLSMSIAGVVSGTPTAAGTFTPSITATNGAGTSPAVDVAFTVAKGSQSITFGSLPSKTTADADFSPGATSATSGINAISYSSSNTAVATIVSNQIHIVRAGTSTITASQAGNSDYNAATSVDQTLTVTQFVTPQSITFGTLSAKTYGDANFDLTATASSGLTVSYSSSNTAVATVSGSTVSIIGPGTTTITASQAGTSEYNPATSVNQDLVVNVKPLTVTDAAVTTKTYDGTTAAVITGTLTGIVGTDVVTLTGTGTFADANANTGISVTSTSTLGGANAAKYSLTQPTGLTGDINKASQTITLASTATKYVGDASYTLAATSTTSATNALSYSSSNTGVATIDPTTGLVTIISNGTTTFTVSQGGSTNYNPATDATQILTVNTEQTLLFLENFDYTSATDLTTNGWNITGTNASPTIAVTTSSISYPGYLSSGIGNEVSLAASGQDVNKTIIAKNTGTIYASFIVNVSSASTTGDYFFNLGPSSISTTYRGRIFVKKNASNKLAFGIAQSTSSPNYTDFNYDLNNSYLVVLKYNIVSGSSNDNSAIIVNPSLKAGIPTSGWISNTDASGADATEIGTVALRQGSNGVALKLDGIRVSTKWSEIVGEAPSFTGTGNWNDPLNWSGGVVPSSTNGAIISNDVTITTPTTIADITLSGSKTITITPSSSLTISNSFTNNGTIILQSDATGTATLLTPASVSGSGTATVQQFLTGVTGSAGRGWWYVSSPISNATSAVFNPAGGTYKFGYWDETNFSYPQILDNATSLATGKGYIFYNPTADATISFNGALNTGDITINPTRTGTDDGARGFNLIGNPYPSFLDWNAATKTNVRSTIWYRTWSAGGSMTFDTFDGTVGTGNGINGNVNRYIPPMQAFWVKVNADGDAGTVIFHNADRSHQDQSNSNNRLKTKSSENSTIVRLKVSNGSNSDEAILVGDVNASNAFDSYDSPKMKVNSSEIPEIFTIADQQELVINHLNSITNNTELPLGFRPGKIANFTISATEITNLDSNLKLILKDNNNEYELANGNSYSFSSDATATNSRFSIIFKSNSTVTSTANTNSNNVIISSNKMNGISITLQGNDHSAKATLYNIMGKELQTTTLKAGLNNIPSMIAGVYIVKISTTTGSTEHKVVIK